MSVRNLLIATSVIATGFAGGLALAQPNTQPGPMGPGPHGQHMQMQADQAGPARFIEGRIAFLRTELKLTAAQQPLFDTLANEMRASATAMQARFEAHRQQASAQQPVQLSAVERLEQRQAMMKEMVAAQDRYLAALKPLYQSLSDEQKKTADTLLAKGMGGHGMAKHGMMGKHGARYH